MHSLTLSRSLQLHSGCLLFDADEMHIYDKFFILIRHDLSTVSLNEIWITLRNDFQILIYRASEEENLTKVTARREKKCFSSAIKHVRWTRFSRFYARIFFFSWHMKRGASSLRHKTRWALSCCWGGEVDAREDEEKSFSWLFLCVFSLSRRCHFRFVILLFFVSRLSCPKTDHRPRARAN